MCALRDSLLILCWRNDSSISQIVDFILYVWDLSIYSVTALKRIATSAIWINLYNLDTLYKYCPRVKAYHWLSIKLNDNCQDVCGKNTIHKKTDFVKCDFIRLIVRLYYPALHANSSAQYCTEQTNYIITNCVGYCCCIAYVSYILRNIWMCRYRRY